MRRTSRYLRRRAEHVIITSFVEGECEDEDDEDEEKEEEEEEEEGGV